MADFDGFKIQTRKDKSHTVKNFKYFKYLSISTVFSKIIGMLLQ